MVLSEGEIKEKVLSRKMSLMLLVQNGANP